MSEIKVITIDGEHTVIGNEFESVLVALQKAGIGIQAPCNGRGTCKKCKITVNGENTKVLACQTYPKDDMTIKIGENMSHMHVLSEFVKSAEGEVNDPSQLSVASQLYYRIAIDLGTTTVVAQLLCIENGEARIIQTARGLNPQSSFGADVISRITAAHQGMGFKLADMIRSCIRDFVWQVCYQNNIGVDLIDEILVGGNTTMIYLLQQWDASSLGRYPFEVRKEAKEFGTLITPTLRISTFPAISAFVGGDIVAGLYALNFYKEEKVCLLVDLGTNGEIALGNRDRIFVTSTAAGPAFEGGNLSCGIGSVSGAISHVTIKKRYVATETIDNKPAIGLCGTGAIDVLAELLSKGYIDQHGGFCEQFRDTGFPIVPNKIVFTQEDIRQMQLAKGAIRTGIEALRKEYGIQYDKIDRFYLAGGMGFSLNIKNAVAIGLIPEELREKVVVVGNSCLGGLTKYLELTCQTSGDHKKDIEEMLLHVKQIQLAEEFSFSEDYLKYMEFYKVPSTELVVTTSI